MAQRWHRLALHALAIGMAATPAAMRAQESGTLVVLNRADATATLIDLATRQVYATLPTGEAPHEVAVSPDGRWAIVSNYGPAEAPGNTLSVIDIQEARLSEPIRLGAHRRPHGLAWLKDGTHALVTTEADSTLLLVNVPQGTVEAAIPTGQAISNMVALSPDGSRAYVANIGSGSATMVDVASRRVIWTTPLAAGAEGIAVTPDGREVWVACRAANRIAVVGAPGLDTLASLPSPELPIRVQFTPDGKLALVTLARSSELRMFDVAKRQPVGTVKMRVDRAAQQGRNAAEGWDNDVVPIGLVIAPDGKTAYVAATGADIIAVVDIRKRAIVDYLPAGREPDGMAYSKVVGATR